MKLQRRRTSLQLTFTLSLTLFTVCVIGAVSWFAYRQGETVLLRELQKHGVSLTENLAHNSEYGLLFSSLDILTKLVESVARDEDVLYAVIMTPDGQIVVESGLTQHARVEHITQKRFPEFLHWLRTKPPAAPALKIFISEKKKGIYDIFMPVLFTSPVGKDADSHAQAVPPGKKPEQEVLGVAVVGLSFDRATSLLKTLQFQILGLALFIVLLALIIARFLVKTISEPIAKLASGTRRIARGDLTQEVDIRTADELGELAHSFNFMMHEMRYSRQELEHWAQTLEQRVQERTREIQEKNQQLTELVETMQRIQEQLVQSEKMASLGQLVAGIAHEINNPVNFISANIAPLKQYIEDVKQVIHQYEQMDGFSPEQQVEMEHMKHTLDFEFLLTDLDDLIRDMEAGALRIKRIVQDLRNFSRLDEAELKQIDIHESLNTTLNLLGHLYEKRITVHKQYAALPPVECYAGQLNQVFMNILANAAQAIDRDKRGNVWLTTMIADIPGAPEHSPRICITIRDDGRGIPEDVLPRIFDPFFTTKDVGEGTGLGLSISYGIIEKHHGEITVKSQVGEGTEFTIIIPQKLSVELTGKSAVEESLDDVNDQALESV